MTYKTTDFFNDPFNSNSNSDCRCWWRRAVWFQSLFNFGATFCSGRRPVMLSQIHVCRGLTTTMASLLTEMLWLDLINPKPLYRSVLPYIPLEGARCAERPVHALTCAASRTKLDSREDESRGGRPNKSKAGGAAGWILNPVWFTAASPNHSASLEACI